MSSSSASSSSSRWGPRRPVSEGITTPSDKSLNVATKVSPTVTAAAKPTTTKTSFLNGIGGGLRASPTSSSSDNIETPRNGASGGKSYGNNDNDADDLVDTDDDEPSSLDFLYHPKLPEDADFEYCWEVEWGRRPGQKGYDEDSELAPRPRRVKHDACLCTPPKEAGQVACNDLSCVCFACQEECPPNCPTGAACGNRRIDKKQFKPCTVIPAGKKGYGLRLDVPAKKGEIISEYVGRAVKAGHIWKLLARYQRERRLYIFHLDDGVYLDARQKGGLARFINHSCSPNVKVDRWRTSGINRAAVIALRDIKVGEELTFDYQWVRQRGRAPTICHCGSDNCRGTLELRKSLEEEEAYQRQCEGHWRKKPSGVDESMINRTVQIFSKEQQKYVIGEVTQYNAENKRHYILYRHDWKEVWENLAELDWMILDEKLDAKDNIFIIAKKQERRQSPTTTGSLLPALRKSFGFPNRGSTTMNKNYLYVQTPIKEAIWATNTSLKERCERNCKVQINAQQFARPPVPPVGPEDEEKYQALDRSLDGTVWKLTVTGCEVLQAVHILQKHVTWLETKAASSHTPSTSTGATASTQYTDSTQPERHEVVFPRMIADAVKKRMQAVRDICRNVAISIAASESISKEFCRLVVEGNLLSDVRKAQEVLWEMLVKAANEANAPKSPRNVHYNLGFLGGTLDSKQFQLLCNNSTSQNGCSRQGLQCMAARSFDVQSSPFFVSFESTYKCTIWVQSDEDKGRINSKNRLVSEAAADAPVKVFFGCHPSGVERLWELIQSRVQDLEGRRLQFLYLGADRRYQKLMMSYSKELFAHIADVIGATVSIDFMTGDFVRIDGTKVAASPVTPLISLDDDDAYKSKMTAEQRASIAGEMIRLQIESFRDQCTREQKWIFGRDWTLGASSSSPAAAHNDTSDPEHSSSKSSGSAFGTLDQRSAAAHGAVDIAEVVAALSLPRPVAAHACTILYRFVHTCTDKSSTKIKLREAILATVHLANKTQQVNTYRRLDVVIQAGYKVFYPGTDHRTAKEEMAVLGERVVSAEREILRVLDYDIFWRGVNWIAMAATGTGKLDPKLVQQIFDFAFSGSVLAAGAELWLKYGVDYVVAAAAAFIMHKPEHQNDDNQPNQQPHLEKLIFALSLIPLKVSQAARLLLESAKLRSTNKKAHSHPLLEAGKERLEQHMPRIEKTCIVCMTNMEKFMKDTGKDPENRFPRSETEKRYKIINDRSRRRHCIVGVPATVIQDRILPAIDGIMAESTCSIFLRPSRANDKCRSSGALEDIVIDGSWRAIAVAEYLIRASVTGVAKLQEPEDASSELLHSEKVQAKECPGLVHASAIHTNGGWDGTIQANLNDQQQMEWGKRIGGKGCWPGRILEGALQDAGLRWWIPPKHGPSPTGVIHDTFLLRACTDKLRTWGKLANALTGNSAKFQMLASQSGESSDARDRSVAVSLHRWPAERVSKKEVEGEGFSPAALKEMQLLTELHSLIPSPQGHPNFMLPVGIAVPGDATASSSDAENIHKQRSAGNEKGIAGSAPGAEDPMYSMFRSTKENEINADKDKQLRDWPHIVLQPTPFILQRFMKKKIEPPISSTILASWCHDLLSALVHGHGNHVLFRTAFLEQVVVDHSGAAKVGGLYRSKVLAPEEDNNRTPELSIPKHSKKSPSSDDKEGKFSSDMQYLAPEILLGSTEHTKASDVWSVASVLAHLLLNKSLFAGKGRSAVILSQFKVVGYPSKNNGSDLKKLPYYTKPPKAYPRGVEKAFEAMLPNPSQHGKLIDLLSKMLHLDPAKRCTAEEALSHPFMADYMENSGDARFREEYASDWVGLKQRFVQASDSDRDAKEKERQLKRKAKLIAASKAGDGEDDDLYDMDELLGNTGTNKKRKS